MEIDSKKGQRILSLLSLAIGITVSVLAYRLGYNHISQGIVFGLLLVLVNYRVLSKVLQQTFGRGSPYVSRVKSFLVYHLRFWIMVLILYLVIPKTDLYFGIGTFIGLLIPKLAMGPIVYQRRRDEWWLQKFAASEPPEPTLSPLEKELLAKDPFEVDPVGIEINRYFDSIKGV